MTILDKINELLSNDDTQNSPFKKGEGSDEEKLKTWYSFEFFPPKTTAGKFPSLKRSY